MPNKISTTFYRHLLKEAWIKTWKRKGLWIFGFFAAIMPTTSIVDITIKNASRISSDNNWWNQIVNGNFAGYQMLTRYLHLLQTTGSTRASITFAILIILFLLFIALIVWSQCSLISGLHSKKAITPKDCLKNSASTIFHIFSIDLLSKITSMIFVFFATLLFILAVKEDATLPIVAILITNLLFFPFMIGIHIITILSLIDTSIAKTHTLDAIHNAIKQTRRHALAATELALILFLLIFTATLVFVALILLLSVPATIISIFSLLSGNHLVFLIVHGLSILILLSLIFLFIGIITSFQYSVWVCFYDNVQKKNALSIIRSKIHRLGWG